MKLYENTTYYCIMVNSPYSSDISLRTVKIIQHRGECKITPIQELTCEWGEKKHTVKLNFDSYLLKNQNNHIYLISPHQALCLTIADCKQFIKQFYKRYTTGIKWWIPKQCGIIARQVCHKALINLNNNIKQIEITQCIQ